MSRLLAILLLCIMLCCPSLEASAQSKPSSVPPTIPLLQQNPLIAEVARKDPDGLWDLVSRLNVLTTAGRDSGPARSASAPTGAEAAQLDTNPALALAYKNDPGATVALLRAANLTLERAHLRQARDAPKRLALVVGSAGDQNWGKLATAANDANLLADTLTRRGFALFGGHALIDPDRPQLLQAIKDFSRSIGPDTVALVYYAGHGIQLNGRSFLIPAHAAVPRKSSDYDSNLVAIDDVVLRQMQQANARLNIVVLDACNTDLAPQRAMATGQDPRQLVPGLALTSLPLHLSNTVIMYSSAPNDVAYDSIGAASDSPFAKAFTDAISKPGLELRDAFDQVQTAVVRATDHRQQPWISYSAMDKFYFDRTGQMSDELSAAITDDGRFHCPSPGSSITLAEAGGTVRGTYQATDPTDPVSCRIATATGETQTLLYNFYDPQFLLDQAQLRHGMDDLLSNRKDQVEFRTSTMWGGISGGPKTFLESWKRLGEEMLSLGPQLVRTVKFERMRQGLTVYSPRVAWYVWYYPAARVFVRSERLPEGKSDFASGGLPGAFKATSFAP